jgi:WD40 repeat protein/Ca2+-binding EF-hand superfamily protein
MDIMMSLEASSLRALHEDFDQDPDGLELEPYLSVFLKRLPKEKLGETPEEKVMLIKDLVELFEQVDVNGDGSMEWDEFTGYCIDSGMAATKHKAVVLSELYAEARYRDRNLHGAIINSLTWFPEVEKLCVIGENKKELEVYDGLAIDGPCLLHKILSSAALAAGRDNIEAGVVLACAHLPKLNLIAIATGDLAINLFSERYARSANSVPSFRKRAHTPMAQSQLQWCGWQGVGILFSCGGRTPVVQGWSVQMVGADLEMDHVYSLKKHTDMITDFCFSTGFGIDADFCVLVTASMDRTINVWGMGNMTDPNRGPKKCHRKTMLGHDAGILCLADCKDGRTVISCGFDYDAYVWDVKALDTAPIIRLRGHRFPLRRCHFCNGRGITIDKKGWMKYWNLTTDLGAGQDRCLQTIHPANKDWKPSSTVALYPHKRLVFAAQKLLVFDTVRIRPKELPICSCIYNDTSQTIIAATGMEVKMWDANSANMVHLFHECTEHEISKMVLDDRKRKFILADIMGHVKCFNYLNGAMMKDARPHTEHISEMIYSVEDRCIITVSWDRKIVVLDEEPGEDDIPILRTITDAHSNDISSAAFSHPLSLIASGDSQGVVKLWDFQFMSFEGFCQDASGIEITCMKFVDPYPILLVADYSSQIKVYTVRPAYPRNELIGTFSNSWKDKWDQTAAWPVMTMETLFNPDGGVEIADGVKEGTLQLVCGDEGGNVAVLDLGGFLKAAGITACNPDKLPISKNNYFARRQVERVGDGLKPAKEDTVEEGDELSLDDFLADPTNDAPAKSPTAQHVQTTVTPLPTQLTPNYRTNRRPKSSTKKQTAASLPQDGLPSITRSKSAPSVPTAAEIHGSANGAASVLEPETRHSKSQRFLRHLSDTSPKKKRPGIRLLRRFEAHQTRIKSISASVSPELLLTASDDLSLRLFNLSGTAQGILTRGEEGDAKYRGRKVWISPVDGLARENEKLAYAEELVDIVKQYEDEQDAEEEEEERKREKLAEQRRRHEAGDGEDGGSTDEVRRQQERLRLVGQIEGEKTWVLSDAEVGRIRAREEAQAAIAARAAKKAAKRSAEEAEDAEMIELLSDPPPLEELRKLKNQSTGCGLTHDDEDNWDLAGDNKQKQLYPRLYSERHRVEMLELEKLEKSKGPDLLQPSPWLLDQYRVHSNLVKQIELKEQRIHDSIQKSQKLLAAVMKEAKEKGRQRKRKPRKLKDSERDQIEVAKEKALRAAIAAGQIPQFESPEDAQRRRQSAKKLEQLMSSFDTTVHSVLRDEEEAERRRKERQRQLDASRHKKKLLKRKKGGKAVSRKTPPETSLDTHAANAAQEAEEERARMERIRLKKKLHFGTYGVEYVKHMRHVIKQLTQKSHDKHRILLKDFIAMEVRDAQRNVGKAEGGHIKDHLESMFKSLESDNSGMIDVEDLIYVLFTKTNTREREDITDYIKMEQSPRLNGGRKELTPAELSELHALFKLWDDDSSETLEPDEIAQALSFDCGINEQDLAAIIQDADKDGNGVIDRAEFVEMMRDLFDTDKKTYNITWS